MPRPRPVVLCILDGWGDSDKTDNNAIALGQTPNWDRLAGSVPFARLDASGDAVGLPAGQFGNSEVGHMNLGAGRVVLQDLPRIDAAIRSGELADKRQLREFIEKLKASGGTCHLLGLLSPGGVHSHVDQILALAGMVAGGGVAVAIHAFLDGRDTPPRDGLQTMRQFLEKAKSLGDVFIATVSGRYYPLDRDNRWDRVEKAYNAMVSADGEKSGDALGAIEKSYAAGLADEFMLPTIISDYAGMNDGDGLLMAHFRADRARQILTALADPDFDGFNRQKRPDFAACLGLVEYSSALNRLLGALFRSDPPPNTLGQVVSDAGMKQLRIAETEKYAHVTFFLNGGREDVFPGEERILVPSPQVATYDLQPEMSAAEVTDHLVRVINDGRMDLIVVNYANGDMVGHTGILDAAMRAVECIDACLGRLEDAVIRAGGVLLITADHGNCENMIDPKTNQPLTQHTTNRVPVLMINPPAGVRGLKDGRLSDVAPTLLNLLGLGQPEEMTGRSLIEFDEAETAAA